MDLKACQNAAVPDNHAKVEQEKPMSSISVFERLPVRRTLPYLNVGVEYGYGARENRNGSDFDNHRLDAGFQFF